MPTLAPSAVLCAVGSGRVVRGFCLPFFLQYFILPSRSTYPTYSMDRFPSSLLCITDANAEWTFIGLVYWLKVSVLMRS